jgi:hypothetical protein
MMVYPRILAGAILWVCLVTSALAQPAGWLNFENRAGGFAVLMPAEPMERGRSLTLIAGGDVFGQVERKEFTAARQGTVYRVAYFVLSDRIVTRAAPDQLLDMVRDAKLRASQGKLLAERQLDLANNPGRELEVALPNGVRIQSRLLVTPFHLYDLMVAWRPGQGDKAQAETFLDSFQLLD